MLTQVGVKQLTDFLRTVTAASDLVDCTLVNCESGLVDVYAQADTIISLASKAKLIWTLILLTLLVIP